MKWQRDEFHLSGPDDFVRLDGLCGRLSGDFFEWLQTPGGGARAAEAASEFAHAADRYLRDFVVEILETGPADPNPALPRLYLGNWYLLNTLTPSHPEVDRILESLRALYEYLNGQGIVAPGVAEQIADELRDAAHFHRRLDEFWELTPEHVGSWRGVDDFRRQRKRRDFPP